MFAKSILVSLHGDDKSKHQWSADVRDLDQKSSSGTTDANFPTKKTK